MSRGSSDVELLLMGQSINKVGLMASEKAGACPYTLQESLGQYRERDGGGRV